MKLRKNILFDNAIGSELSAVEIHDARGRSVIRAGEVLNHETIEVLQKRGIYSAVVIMEEDISEEELFSRQKNCSDQLAKKFSHFEDDETMLALKQVLLEYCLDKVGFMEGD